MRGLLVLFLSIGVIAVFSMALTGELYPSAVASMQSTATAGTIVP